MRSAELSRGPAVPVGDPHALVQLAAQLRRAGRGAEDAHRDLATGASHALSGWRGAAAEAFGRTSSRVLRGCGGLGPAQQQAARLLETYAHVLADAQDAARRAQRLLDDASDGLERGLAAAAERERLAASGDAATAAQEVLAARALVRRAEDDFARARAAAERLQALAADDLATAGATLARGLHEVADQLAHLTQHELVDVLGAPNTLLELDTLGLVGASTRRALSLYDALRSADLASAERLAATSFDEVAATAARYGEDSPEALRAWYAWQEGALSRSLGEVGSAVDGLGPLAEGPLRGLDVVSRLALPLGAAADVLTLADGRSSALDRALSGGNLAGIGLAASGTELGGTALMLVGVDSVAAWVPVAGEVVLGATALYLAGEWAYAHRQELADAGRDVVHGVEDAATWAAEQERAVAGAGYDLARSAVSGVLALDGAVLDATSAAAHAGAAAVEHAAGAALDGAAGLAEGATHQAAEVLSSLDPF